MSTKMNLLPVVCGVLLAAPGISARKVTITIRARAISVSSKPQIAPTPIPTNPILVRAELNPIVVRISGAKPPIATIRRAIVPAIAGSPLIAGKDTRIIRITAISRPIGSPTLINRGSRIIAASRTTIAAVTR